jgi:aromatic ring-cleaving dioxygenase
VQLSTPESSFTALIDHLKLNNDDLSIQIHRATAELDMESKRRQLAEEDNRRLKDHQTWLEEQLQNSQNLVVHFQGIVSSLFAVADTILPELEEIRQRACVAE